MICNNFTDQRYRVILSQYLNNFYTEFLPITDKIGVKFRERGKNIFKYGQAWLQAFLVIQFICWISRENPVSCIL